MTRIRPTVPRLAAAVRVADVTARGASKVVVHSPPCCSYVVRALLDSDPMSRGAPAIYAGGAPCRDGPLAQRGRRPSSPSIPSRRFPGNRPPSPRRGLARRARRRALAAIRAWEASVERDWLAGGAWAIIQGDPRYDVAATDAEDPDYAGNVAVFDDSSRLLAKAEGWTVGPRRRARDPLT